MIVFNPYANHEYSRFKFVLLADLITVIGNKGVFKPQNLQMFHLKLIWVICIHLSYSHTGTRIDTLPAYWAK